MSSTPPRRFNYDAFIEDLKPLIAQGKVLNAYGLNHEEPQFKRWRLEVQDLLGRIESKGYNANATILANRVFRSMSRNGDSSVKYKRDLNDTLNEMEVLLANYEKYGDPKAVHEPTQDPFEVNPLAHIKFDTEVTPVEVAPAPAVPAPLLPPEKVTWEWAKKHMSWQAWTAVGLLIGGAFSIGTTVGRWSAKLDRYVAPAPTTAPVATATPAPAPKPIQSVAKP